MDSRRTGYGQPTAPLQPELMAYAGLPGNAGAGSPKETKIDGAAPMIVRKPRPRMMMRPKIRNDQTIYRTYAPNWWDGSRRFLRLLHNLVPARLNHFDPVIGSWSGKSVLDLGCGGGFMAEALARKGAAVIGVDPSSSAIRVARDHAQSEGLEIDYLVGNGEGIPLGDHSVHCVVCVDVLEHVEDLGRVLDEIRRVLKPSGLFFFDTIHRNPFATLIVVHLGETLLRLLPRGTHDPAKFIRPSELRKGLLERDFDVGPFVGLGPNGINRRLDLTFGRLPTQAIMYAGHASLRPHEAKAAVRVDPTR